MSDDATKTFTQDEVNAIVRERIERATKKFADYDDIKAQLTEYETANAASKSELEKLTDQVTKLTEDNAKQAREALVARVARDAKITDADDIALFLTGSDEATLVKQAERLAARNGEVRRQNLVIPTEGQPIQTDPAGGQELRELAHSLFSDAG